MKHFKQSWKEKIRYGCSMLLSAIINSGVSIQHLKLERILCIREDEIGDMCYSLHVFELLKQRYPKAQITLLCKPYTASLVQSHPALNKIVHDYSNLQGRYDLIVDLRGSWKSMLYGATHFPKARLDRATVRFANSKQGHPHEVITNWQVIAPLFNEIPTVFNPKIYTDAETQTTVDAFLKSHSIGKFAVLHTGARKELRRWNQYQQLAIYLIQQLNIDIVFTGDASEIPEISLLQKQIPFPTFSVAGIFDLQHLASLCKRAEIFVGNESGPLHIAAISGTKCLGLFGPGEPYVFYPWGTKNEVIHHILECNPCNQIDCVHADNPCIQRISMLEVIEKINKLLS